MYNRLGCKKKSPNLYLVIFLGCATMFDGLIVKIVKIRYFFINFLPITIIS
jgi:hypothetical protein